MRTAQFQKKWRTAIPLVCIILLLLGFVIYTAAFFAKTKSKEDVLQYMQAYSYQQTSPPAALVESRDAVSERNGYTLYTATPNAENVQELYLFKNVCWLGLCRYKSAAHTASPLEPIGNFLYVDTAKDGSRKSEYFFYSDNALKITKIDCNFSNAEGETYITSVYTTAVEPFVRCVELEDMNWKLRSISAYNHDGEEVYTFRTGLFPTA